MKVDFGTEAALYPEKEYINGFFVAVCTVRNGIFEFPSLGGMSLIKFSLAGNLNP